jgi:hypothetical protein
MLEPEIDPVDDDVSLVAPEPSDVAPGCRAGVRWPEPVWAPRVGSDDDLAAKRQATSTALAGTAEFRAVFPEYVPVTFTPGRRDPFY